MGKPDRIKVKQQSRETKLAVSSTWEQYFQAGVKLQRGFNLKAVERIETTDSVQTEKYYLQIGGKTIGQSRPWIWKLAKHAGLT